MSRYPKGSRVNPPAAYEGTPVADAPAAPVEDVPVVVEKRTSGWASPKRQIGFYAGRDFLVLKPNTWTFVDGAAYRALVDGDVAPDISWRD